MDGANRRFPQLIMTRCRSPAVRCIRATLSGKVDDLQFAPLRAHISFEESTPSHAWLCSMAQVSLWRRRDHEPAAISDSGGGVVRDGRSRDLGRGLVGCPPFG